MQQSGNASRFAVLLLPAIISQSMIMGGGYSTGREIMQYAGRFGPSGWLAVVVIFVGFALTSVLAFELARIGQAYDYKKWARLLVGPLWPLVDLLLFAMMMLVIAVMSAAIGSILFDTLGVPRGVGLGVAFVAVGFLAFRGTAVMERFKTFGSVILYLAYIGFALLVLTSDAGPSPGVEVPAEPVATTGEVVFSAVQYVGYNLATFPAVLFCLWRQTRRSETITSGVISGLAMTLPFALTFMCVVRFWPDPAIVEAEVPWLPMLERAATSAGGVGVWTSIFGLVAGWTLLETAVGSIHALVDRIEHNLGDLPRELRPRGGEITPTWRAVVSISILALATLLARVGIIDLVARGYSLLSYGFIVLIAIPLLTIGSYRMLTSPAVRAETD